MLKHLSLGLAASAVFVGTAIAADMPAVEPVDAAIAEAADWSGFYVGIHGGIATGESVFASGAPGVPDLEYDTGGGFGGAQAGFNLQKGSFVFGVEADVSAGAIDGSESQLVDVGGGTIADISTGSEVSWVATFRGRVGYAFDNLLVYATGGAAYAAVEQDLLISVGGVPLVGVSDESENWGYTIGGGFEFRATENISLKTEYLLVDIEDDSGTLPVDVQLHTLKAGLNYHF